MNATCRRIQDTLASEGAQALRADEAAQRHLADCADCFAVLESLNALDAAFDALPSIDAPEDTVAGLLARQTDPAPTTRGGGGRWFPAGWRSGLRWSLPLAGVATAALLLLLLPPLRTQTPDTAEFELARVEAAQSVAPSEEDALLDQAKEERLGGVRPGFDGLDSDAVPETEPASNEPAVLGPGAGAGQERFGDLSVAPEEPRESETLAGRVGNRRVDAPASRPTESNVDRDQRENVDAVDTFQADDLQTRSRDAPETAVVGGVVGTPTPSTPPTDGRFVRVGGDTGLAPPERTEYVAPVFPDVDETAGAEGVVLLEIRIAENGEVSDIRILRSNPLLDAAIVEAVSQWKYAPPIVDGVAVPVVMTIPVSYTAPPDADATRDEPRDGGSLAARAFLEERARVDGLSFQSARGYWANTYVPGDPVLRRLGATLHAPGSAPPAIHIGRHVQLHEASRRVAQPFDRPDDAALAVYMASDHDATDGPRRALIQVGLQAAPRHAGHGVATRLAVVVDLRGPLTRELLDPVRAILEAFAAAQRPADRFTLIAAGRDLVLSADEFRYGAINVALRDLREAGPRRPATRDLESAMRLAVRTVAAESAPPTTPGAGAVILVTGRPLGASEGALERLAGRSAAAGIPVSVVGVGGDVDLAAIDRLVLAGQGNRRLLTSASDAPALVDRELSASSRVVARALRLRIRLAPGVRLVDVIGSKRLDARQATQVRETERRLDRELARSLGIESDRGDDDDGIQIVIPGFHAGDSHVILLDVVAPGPGPLADVTVRYKDLVFLRNSVARATASLRRGEDQVGPLQANVLKNFLAYRLSATLERSARLLSRQQPAAARRTLVEAGRLLAGLRGRLRGLVTDPDLGSDLGMLQEYVRLLEADTTAAERAYWSRSIRYAGLLKILPRPVT